MVLKIIKTQFFVVFVAFFLVILSFKSEKIVYEKVVRSYSTLSQENVSFLNSERKKFDVINELQILLKHDLHDNYSFNIKELNNYFVKKNINFFEKYDYYISENFPVVVIKDFDNCFQNYKKIKKLSCQNEIEKIIFSSFYTEKNFNQTFSIDTNAFPPIKEEDDGGAGFPYSYRGYTGKNVVIGILDSGIVDENLFYFKNTKITQMEDTRLPGRTSHHANLVASLALGSAGIAKKADLLSARMIGSLYDEFDWFIKNKVNIVNISMKDYHTNFDNTSQYTLNSSYIDYVVKKHNILVVGAAGNSGIPNKYVVSPNTAYNSLTVGGLKSNLSDLWEESSYKVKFEISKPNLVEKAVGYRLFGDKDYINGTSFACPQVSGAAAVLMEKNPSLKSNPSAVMSIIMANCKTLMKYKEKKEDGFNEKVGAGILDIYSIVDNSDNYCSVGNFSDQNYELGKKIFLKANYRIKICLTTVVDSNYPNNLIGLYNNYDLVLLNSKKEVVVKTSGKSNTKLIDYEVNEDDYYYISTILKEPKNNSYSERSYYAYKIY